MVDVDLDMPSAIIDIDNDMKKVESDVDMGLNDIDDDQQAPLWKFLGNFADISSITVREQCGGST